MVIVELSGLERSCLHRIVCERLSANAESMRQLTNQLTSVEAQQVRQTIDAHRLLDAESDLLQTIRRKLQLAG